MTSTEAREQLKWPLRFGDETQIELVHVVEASYGCIECSGEGVVTCGECLGSGVCCCHFGHKHDCCLCDGEGRVDCPECRRPKMHLPEQPDLEAIR